MTMLQHYGWHFAATHLSLNCVQFEITMHWFPSKYSDLNSSHTNKYFCLILINTKRLILWTNTSHFRIAVM